MPSSSNVELFRCARRDHSLVVLEGLHALKHAKRFGAGIVIAVSDAPQAALALAERIAPDVIRWLAAHLQEIPTETFEALAPTAPGTRVLAIAVRPSVAQGDLWAGGERPIVLLDRPRNLGNLGAAIRVAAAASADAVVVYGDNDPWHPTAVRGAAGLQFAVPSWRMTEPLPSSRPLVALVPEAERTVGFDIPANAILAFGSERDGLAPEVTAKAALICRLPMRHGVSSLNLATAVAATLYRLMPPE